jgi:hypothetical protein
MKIEDWKLNKEKRKNKKRIEKRREKWNLKIEKRK